MADPAFTLSIILGVVLCGLSMLWVLYSSSGWHRASKYGARLPKGSFSWPIIGDTLALDHDPLSWGISQAKRYGKIFKASIFFRKSIVGTTPEFAKFVLHNPDLFKMQYPKNLEFIAPRTIFFREGPRHLVVKKLLKKTVGLPESLQAMFETLEGIVFENLASWEQKGTVIGSEAADRLAADTASYVALGIKNIHSTPEGILAIGNLLLMIEVIGSPQVNLPGTTYNKGLKARADLRRYVRDLLVKRRSQEDMQTGTETTIFQALVEAQKDAQAKGAGGVDYDDETIVDDALAAWFGAYKATATTLTWTLKILVDDPKIIRRVQAEQQQILQGKDLSVPGPRLTWNDTKKMVYTTKSHLWTCHVLPRIAEDSFNHLYNSKNSSSRHCVRRFLIPKGWQVLPMINLLHANHANYPDPLCFNPDRFDAPPKPYTYIPFGSGIHRCPGEDFAKVVTLIYIHYLTTTYTYEPVCPDLGKSHKLYPIINGGYPINICRRI